jgi:hypothetical protein
MADDEEAKATASGMGCDDGCDKGCDEVAGEAAR